MDCQRCGRRDALIHLTEISGGRTVNVWLCPACARDRQASRKRSEESDEALFGDRGISRAAPTGEGDPLAAFLGEEGLQYFNSDPAGEETCPTCGFKIETFFRLNRLGCPGCYRAFAPNLRPILARLHGRAIHLGKVPQTNFQGHNPLAEMTRTRVALEKAITAEDFEEAARLRDLLKSLQAMRDRDTETR